MVTVTSVKLNEELKSRVKYLADVRRRSAHWIMCEAIAQYVEREERHEKLKYDTLQAWEEFQSSGLHASGEEVDRWLTTWGTEQEQPAPICRK